MIFTEILKAAIESYLARNGSCTFANTTFCDFITAKNLRWGTADFDIRIYHPGVAGNMCGIYVDGARVSMAKISDDDLQKPDCDPSEIVDIVLKYLIKNRFLNNK